MRLPVPRAESLDTSRHFSAFDIEAAVAFAEEKNKAGFNVYVGAALRQGTRCGRASGANFLAAAHAWIDFDKSGDAERINAILKADGLRPAVVVVTGTVPHPRMHCFFKLEGSATADQLKAANTTLKTLLGSDAVENVDRLLRLAGTVNFPTPKKKERGYVTELVTLDVRKDAPSFTIDHLIGLAGKPSDKGNPANSAFGFDTKAGRTDDEIVELLKRSRVKGEWHNAIRNAIATMIGRGWSDLQIKLACAPYCEGDYKDVDLVPLIEGARKKWDKPNENATASGLDDAEIERLARLSRSNMSGSAKRPLRRSALARRYSTAWSMRSASAWASMATPTAACRAARSRFRNLNRGPSRSMGRRCSTQWQQRSVSTWLCPTRQVTWRRCGSCTVG